MERFYLLYMLLLYQYIGLSISDSNCPMSVSPNGISQGGGVKLTIKGCGFSKNQFDFSSDNQSVGNQVFLYGYYGISIQCDVQKKSTDERQIVCITRPANPYFYYGYYNLKIFSDGIEVNSYLYIWTYYNPPTIMSISPSSGTPNTIVNISGVTFTDLYSSLNTTGSFGVTTRILKVYSSGQICSLMKPNSTDLYGLGLFNYYYGYMVCQIQGSYLGYQNISFILDGPYGSSLISNNLYKISVKHEPYVFQSYPVITAISNNIIGSHGGAHLTIFGQYFDLSEPSVSLNGVSCKAQPPFLSDQINCILDKMDLNITRVNKGNRGVLIEYWQTNDPINNFTFDTNAKNYAFKYADDFSWNFTCSCRYIVRARAFFIVSRTGVHQFFTRNDSQIIVDSKTLNSVPYYYYYDYYYDYYNYYYYYYYYYYYNNYYYNYNYNYNYNNNYTNYNGNKRNFTDNQRVEIQVVSDSLTNELSVLIHNTSYTRNQFATVTNEIQNMYIVGGSDIEIQEIDFSQISPTTTIVSRSEIQEIEISGTSGEYALCAFSACTDWIWYTDTFETIVSKIQNLFSLTNETTVSGDENKYNITFQASLGNIEPLSYILNSQSERIVTITTIIDGITGTDKFYLSFNNITSKYPVDMNNFNQSVTAALTSFFSVSCPSQIERSSNSQFFYDFEDEYYYNSPFCGLKSSSYKYLSVNITLDFNPYLCFGYKNLYGIYFSTSCSQGYSYPWIYLPYKDSWDYSCINILNQAKTNLNCQLINLNYIYFSGYVDNVYIGHKPLVEDNQNVLMQRRVPNFPFNSYNISMVNLTAVRIQISPPNCFSDFLPIIVANVDKTPPRDTWSTDYARINYVTTNRVQKASKGLGGNYSLTYDGYTMNDIPWNMTFNSEKLKFFPTLGEMLSYGYTTCSYVYHSFQFMHGNIKSFTISTDTMIGDIKSADVYVASKSSIRITPIPGDMLQTMEYLPQIIVSSRDILAKCTGNCSVSINTDLNPTLNKVVSVTNSYHNIQLKVNGKGFNVQAANRNWVNLTSIDGLSSFSCVVSSVIDQSSLVCSVNYLPFGQYIVTYVNLDVGYADNSVTYSQPINGDFVVTPVTGSKSGGLLLTINGDGFNTQGIVILIGGNNCPIRTVSSSRVTCILPPQTSGGPNSVNIEVKQSMVTATKVNGFQYDNSNMATITQIYPNNNLSVRGNQSITIEGKLFGTVTFNVQVFVGNTSANITSLSDNKIVINSPILPQGQYPVTIVIAGIGEAQPNTFLVAYVFQIFSITPNTGSYAGGTLISVKGSGFGNDPSVVSVNLGPNSCTVTSVSDSEIICNSSAIFKTVSITLIQDEKGSRWSQRSIHINRGDSLKWNWNSIVPVQISQMTSLNNNTVMADKPNSQEPKLIGSFVRYFSDIGMYGFLTSVGGWTYNYWYYYGYESNNVVVRVREREPIFVNIDVKISGISASQSNAGQSFDMTCPQASCQALPLTNNDPNHVAYVYHPCVTHIINDISPILLEADQNLNLTFLNKVSCTPTIILSLQSTTITCIPPLTDGYNFNCPINGSLFSQLPPLVPITVEVTLSTCGKALFNTNLYTSSPVIYASPKITRISPTFGSIWGGTVITIKGTNLPTTTLNEVLIGSYPCKVMNATSLQIICVTSGVGYQVTSNVNVYITKQSETVPCSSSCFFSYSISDTLLVNSCSPQQVFDKFTLSIFGTNFGSDSSVVVVSVGTYNCIITSISNTLIKADCPNLPLGQNSLTLIHSSQGIYKTSFFITSDPSIVNIDPQRGSVEGGTFLSIQGNGFKNLFTLVTVGSLNCDVRNVTTTVITCITPANAAGPATVTIQVDNIPYPQQIFTYDDSLTPIISSISSNNVLSGDNVTLVGSGWISDTILSVTIDETLSIISTITNGSIVFLVPNINPGVYQISVYVSNQGYAKFQCDSKVQIKLGITSVVLNEGSILGNQNIIISGFGFMTTLTSVTVCAASCTNVMVVSKSQLSCLTPRINTNVDTICDVVVTVQGTSFTMNNGFTYKNTNTAVVTDISPLTGGTAGGTVITITGSGFLSSDNSVIIDGSVCQIISESSNTIVCQTSSHKGSGMFNVEVYRGKFGLAQGIFQYFYIDRWSSIFSWNGTSLPEEGDFVVIPSGQTLLLDVDTPILKILLINGGTLIFDRAKPNITLQSQYILINNGGTLQIGTEDQYYENKANIILHGNYRSKELPLYGVKVIAVRNGTLDLHGKPTNCIWTRLAKTAEAGSTEIELLQSVDWQVGDSIVIATTGDRNSQKETEERKITVIKAGNKVITLDRPLQYRKLGGINPDTGPTGLNIVIGAEVGLLTRNIRIRGYSDPRMMTQIPACPAGFDPGEFAVQTCFQGRFGPEVGYDEFGVHIIARPATINSREVVMRISDIELMYTGQSYRLGRYPIYFDQCGDMTGSYVKRVSVHQSFNRALVIHGSHNILVEFSVFYDIKGGAIFLEDGIEHGNVIQYNLVVKVMQSTSLLNDDLTPAAFWITNPNNTLRHNAAVGGTHFGNWFRINEHPDGESYDPNICPKKHSMGQFKNNSAHSFGWYGLWISPDMFPTLNGACDSAYWIPALFEDFVSWNNAKGAQCDNCGSIQFKGFLMMNNENTGIEGKLLLNTNPFSSTTGPIYENTLIVGSDPQLTSGSIYCTQIGLTLPRSNGLIVSNIVFRNFNSDSCTPISATANMGTGGWNTQFKSIRFDNCLSKIDFRWQSDFQITDLDGSLSGKSSETKTVPWFNVYPQSKCSKDNSTIFNHGVPGAFCDPSLTFSRWASFSTQLSIYSGNIRIYASIDDTTYNDTILNTENGNTNGGWMSLLPVNQTYQIEWIGIENIQNVNYQATLYFVNPNDWIIFAHKMDSAPDELVNGILQSRSIDPTIDPHFSYYFDSSTKILTYLVKNVLTVVSNIQYQVNFYKRFWVPYVPPYVPPPVPSTVSPPVTSTVSPPVPPPVPSPVSPYVPAPDRNTDNSGYVDTSIKYVVWSDYYPPTGCEINSTTYVTANFSFSDACDVLKVKGVLEFIGPNTSNKTTTLVVSILIIYGQVFAGNSSRPYAGILQILLSGSIYDEEYPSMNSVSIGNKAIAVFGDFNLFGEVRSLTWTTLNKTASPGDTYIYVNDPIPWAPGDDIVITTTEYNHKRSEVFKIVTVDIATRQIQIDRSNQYYHYVGSVNLTNGELVKISAEVGLLSRNILISSASESIATYQSFGGRIFASKLWENQKYYIGSIKLFGVELRNMGQFGFIDETDARFALSFLSLDDATSGRQNFVNQCSFNNIYSPAIGAFSTNGLVLDSNVIYRTQGEGIIMSGSNQVIQNNLIVEVNWDGGHYRPMQSASSKSNRVSWTASIDVSEMDLSSGVIVGNRMAGSERCGLNLGNIDCSNNNLLMYDNVIHSTLIGILQQSKDSSTGCNKIFGSTIYRAYDFGIFYEQAKSLLVTNVTLSDNGIGIASIILSPEISSNEVSYKTFNVTNIVVIGTSGVLGCSDTVDQSILTPSINSRSFRTDTGGTFGILTSMFLTSHNGAPKRIFNNAMSYNTIGGKSMISNVEFVNFDQVCSGKLDVAIATNKASDDGVQPTSLSGITFTNTPLSQRIFIHRPNIAKINPSDCVDMDCDGLKKVLFVDEDGSINGTKSAIFSQSEWQWDGDTRRGLGYYRLPKDMLLTPSNEYLNATAVFPNTGIVRTSDCVFNADWEAYSCPNGQYEMLVIESMDADTETRRLSPVAIATDDANGNFVDLINGPQDQGFCSKSKCRLRRSTFLAIVPRQRNFVLYFTSTSPQKLRLRFVNTNLKSSSIRIGIYYSYSGSFNVYRNNEFVMPLNGYYSNGQLLYNASTSTTTYMPDAINGKSGDNYFDDPSKIQYVIVQADDFIEIRYSPVIRLGFNLPSVSVDEFYGSKIVEYLAAFLGIPANKIRIVSIVAETSSSKRGKRAASGGSIVNIEIISSTPTNGSSVNTTDQVTSLNSITEKLTVGLQTGDLSTAMKVQISNPAVTGPLPDPGSSSWSTVAAGVMTTNTSVPIQIPVSFRATIQGINEEGQSLAIQVEALDSTGNHVNSLGTSTTKYKAVLTITNPSITFSSVPSTSYFNTTDNGWAYFTDIYLDCNTSPYNFTINIFTDDGTTSTNRGIITINQSIKLRSFSLSIINFPTATYQLNKGLLLTVQVLNNYTNQNAVNMNWNNHQWQIRSKVCVQPTVSSSSWSSDIISVITPGSNFVILPSISFLKQGTFQMCISLELTNPSSMAGNYPIRIVTPYLTVRDSINIPPANNYRQTVNLVFSQADFGTIENYISQFQAVVFNKIHFDLFQSYSSVLSTGYTFTKGSINVNFQAFSSEQTQLNSFLSDFKSSVQNGSMVVYFNNVEFKATNVAISGETEPPTPINNVPIIVGVVMSIVIIISIVVAVIFIRKAKMRKQMDKRSAMVENEMYQFDNAGKDTLFDGREKY